MSLDGAFREAWEKVLESVLMYRRGLQTGLEFSRSISPEKYRKILIMGVGGSGVVGDIVASLKDPASAVRVETVRSFKVPADTSEDTLAVAVSYSGETTETSWALIDALTKRATVVGISSGGRLTKAMKKQGLDVLPVTPGLQPRYAVPEMVGLVYGMLSSLSGFSERYLLQAVEDLDSFARKFQDPTENEAFEMASSLTDKPVVALGPDYLSAVLTRLKAQFNENAKHPCYVVTAPEAFHNEIEGWTMADKFSYVIVRSEYEGPMVSEALDWCEKRLKSFKANVHRLHFSSPTIQSEILKQIFFVDLLSIGLARHKKVDPIGLTNIPILRPLLRKYFPSTL
ncbi:MAG: SIS domain-containing protein [Candidatus Caldarchaeum sp.]|nr:SIS domain-containing protein [Candidatus Caldarchaeum sp.]